MNFQMSRETLLKPLQAVIGVVERRQTLPILSNVHLSAKDQQLAITATDLEVELQARIPLEKSFDFSEITIPGRKLMDICRSLPEGAQIELVIDKEKALLRSGRSRFSLTTLPANDFPIIRENAGLAEFVIGQKNLLHLTQRTHFAMAQQDVRYYLNGMLLEANEGILRTVATDGHRLALNTMPAPIINNAFMQIIIPRKGVVELMHLLEDSDIEINVQISNHHLRVSGEHFTFTSKLVDGRFPDYEKVLPRGGNKSIFIDRDELKQALNRASILSNEKFRGVRLQLRPGILRIIATNPEHEEAEEEISMDYQQESLEIGFNVTYLLDILNTVTTPRVKMTFSDANSSVLVEEHEPTNPTNNSLFVVMPMRI
jgi:DNA polymerase-3 subunit beta